MQRKELIVMALVFGLISFLTPFIWVLLYDDFDTAGVVLTGLLIVAAGVVLRVWISRRWQRGG